MKSIWVIVITEIPLTMVAMYYIIVDFIIMNLNCSAPKELFSNTFLQIFRSSAAQYALDHRP